MGGVNAVRGKMGMDKVDLKPSSRPYGGILAGALSLCIAGYAIPKIWNWIWPADKTEKVTEIMNKTNGKVTKVDDQKKKGWSFSSLLMWIGLPLALTILGFLPCLSSFAPAWMQPVLTPVVNV